MTAERESERAAMIASRTAGFALRQPAGTVNTLELHIFLRPARSQNHPTQLNKLSS
jgi:hypothetical protein